VYIKDLSGQINPSNSKLGEIVQDSKQLWAFNYSRFIRPGMKRIAANVHGLTDHLVASRTFMVSAYKDEVAKKIVIFIKSSL
jgi:hypothetical protein